MTMADLKPSPKRGTLEFFGRQTPDRIAVVDGPHQAAWYELGIPRSAIPRMEAINIEGTRNVLTLAGRRSAPVACAAAKAAPSRAVGSVLEGCRATLALPSAGEILRLNEKPGHRSRCSKSDAQRISSHGCSWAAMTGNSVSS